MKLVMRSDADVDAVLNECANRIEDWDIQDLEKTFEEGVEAGIKWVLGYSEDHPMRLGK
ncbi:MAG: hypothetical protein AB7W37_06500 [Syntrophobacteraceae bacterium]